MQFWKLLKKLIDEMLPDWRDQFLSYKDLKKQLNRIYSKDDRGNKKLKLMNADNEIKIDSEVEVFVNLCQKQIDKFNGFVLDKQEWYIIRIEVLEGKLVAAKDSSEEFMKVGRELVDLHGEIVLLLNYSALNYIGLVKILKKHDKLSGAIVRLPFIQKVLNEPFYKADILNNLVKKCEKMVDQLFTMNEHQSLPSSSPITKEEEESIEKISIKVPKELVDIKNMENTYMKLTLSALTGLKEIRSASSTLNMFSLPPIQLNNEMEIKSYGV